MKMQSSIESIIMHKSEQNRFLNDRMHATLKCVNVVSSLKRAVVYRDYINLTQTYYHDIKLEMFQHHSKFHPDQLKSVLEKETQRFCFAFTL